MVKASSIIVIGAVGFVVVMAIGAALGLITDIITVFAWLILFIGLTAMGYTFALRQHGVQGSSRGRDR